MIFEQYKNDQVSAYKYRRAPSRKKRIIDKPKPIDRPLRLPNYVAIVISTASAAEIYSLVEHAAPSLVTSTYICVSPHAGRFETSNFSCKHEKVRLLSSTKTAFCQAVVVEFQLQTENRPHEYGCPKGRSLWKRLLLSSAGS